MGESIWRKKTPQIKSKFKVGETVRITKEKGTFAKGYYPNFTEEIFKIAKVLHTVPHSYRIEDLNGENIKGIFYNQELVRVSEKPRLAEILKTRVRKGVKEHFVKWIVDTNKPNSWVKDMDIERGHIPQGDVNYDKCMKNDV